MPPEIRAQIIRDLIDPHDLLNSLKAVESLRRTGSLLNDDVAKLMREGGGIAPPPASTRSHRTLEGVQPTNPILATAGKLFVRKKARLADLPIQSSAMTREEFRLQDNVFKCDLIAVADKNEKSELIRDVLRSRNTPLKYDALDSLALNVAYLEPHDRAELVKSVCTLHRELIEDDIPGGLGGPVKALIERAEHLSPMEQRQLTDAAFETADPTTKTKYLDAFAGKIDVIAAQDLQQRIVDAILDDETEGKGLRLGRLAEKLDRISDNGLGQTAIDSPREKAARAILGLDRHDAGRLWAMSKLVEKLSSVSPQTTLRRAASLAAKELQRPIVEDFEEDGANWHTNPVICRVEMAHHMSSHRNLLTEDEAENVSTFIKGVLGSPGNCRAKAQLLPHMRPRARERFVERHLPAETDLIVQDEELEETARQVTEGMTLRLKDLNKDEKATCAEYLSGVLSSNIAEDAVKYNLFNHLPHFARQDANDIAKAAIVLCEGSDAESAVDVFGHIARQSARLDGYTAAAIVRTTEGMTARLIQDAEPEENAALRSLAVFAAQSVANRSWETLVKGTVGLEDHLRETDPLIRRGYEKRSDDRVR